jgi:phosphoglycolate phosphatase-like HAD superfamily hydrolase
MSSRQRLDGTVSLLFAGDRVYFEEVRRQIGKGGDQLMPVFMTREEIDEYGEPLESERLRIMRDRYLPLIKPFRDVRALLERVRADGKQVALASSATRDDLAAYKRIANIEGLVECRDIVGRCKKKQALSRYLPGRS